MTGLGILVAAITISYGAGLPGDLHLPPGGANGAPVVVCYHGGGWSSMSRHDVRGIADFLVEKGCAVYNVDYRLATAETPWPACGKDCIAAARFVLNGGLAAHGVRPERVWLVGASAGGHLALWTGLSLPPEQVAGIVSISGVADPHPDFALHSERYRALFGGRAPMEADLASADVRLLIRPKGPKVLLTHAREDSVVPEESARSFYLAYRVGHEISFSQYSKGDEPNTGGHCIWRPETSPHRLVARVENEIAHFMGLPGVDVYDYRGEDFARMFVGSGWQVAILSSGPFFSKPTGLERHLTSDETFVLMEGEAMLYVGEEAELRQMERGRVYNVRRGTWHQVAARKGARILVVENAGDVGTERRVR